MAATTRFDISSENFDLYFEQQVASISPMAKQMMPKDVNYKIYRGGSKSNTKSSSKLSFIAKLWILWKFLHKRIWVVVEDEQNGLSIEEYFKLKEAIQAKEKNINKSEEASASMTFITASKELGDCFAALNNSCASPSYNFLQKAKNGIKLQHKNPATEYRKQMNFIAKFITFWEGNKKRWIAEKVVTVPEFLVLIALYEGKEVQSSSIYNGIFKYAFQSSASKVKMAFSSLRHRGLISKTGSTKQAYFNITDLGIATVNSILSKYALNC